MTIIVVDTDAKALDRLSKAVAESLPEAEILRFENSPAALDHARSADIDVALLSTDLPEIGGIDLGQYIKELHPLVNLIFMSETKDCAYDALKAHASGYLLKPVDAERLKKELEDLRHPESEKKHKRAFVQTFGNFEFFVDGKPVAFKYSRTKEIVALLVNNRGAQTTNGEIIGTLWEDDGDPEKKTSYLSNLRQDLQNTLSKLRLSDLIVKQRGSLGIAVDKIECDLYDWLAKKKESHYRYLGDYMNQYSWAEYMHAELDEISYEIEDAIYE